MDKSVRVVVDEFQHFARKLTDPEPPPDTCSTLISDCGTILIPREAATKSIPPLNSLQYRNLFGDSVGDQCRLSSATVSPIQATGVTIAFIRAGSYKDTNFTEHLKVYFETPRILHPGHVFSLEIPAIVPANVPLATWLKHVSRDQNYMQRYHTAHFKVVSAHCRENEISSFFYISSHITSLYEAANIHVKIPKFRADRKIDTFYSSQIDLIISQLTRPGSRSLILVAGTGSCKLDLMKATVGLLGVGLVHACGVDYCGEAAASIETKLSHLTTHVQLSHPCLVYMDKLELMGRTRDGSSHDARVVLAISKFISHISEISSDIYIVGSCSDTDDVTMPVKHLFDSCIIVPKPSIDTLCRFISDHFSCTDILHVLKKKNLAKMTLRSALKLVSELEKELGLGLNDSKTITPVLCEKMLAKLRLTEEVSSVSSTDWADIGGIDHVRREIEETIDIPLKYGHLFGPNVNRSGLLLWGSPGCGKTMVARAIATQCNLSFIDVQGPELLNSFVGQSEANVRDIFDKARAKAPAVLFFDEIDAIAPRRTGGVMDRVVAQLLTEMDAMGNGVFVIAATNRPELLDPALLRPGRLDKSVEVTVGGDVESRVAVFEALSRKLAVSEDVCWRTIAEMSGPLSGAQCYGVLLDACYRAVERCLDNGQSRVVVELSDLVTSLHNK